MSPSLAAREEQPPPTSTSTKLSGAPLLVTRSPLARLPPSDDSQSNPAGLHISKALIAIDANSALAVRLPHAAREEPQLQAIPTAIITRAAGPNLYIRTLLIVFLVCKSNRNYKYRGIVIVTISNQGIELCCLNKSLLCSSSQRRHPSLPAAHATTPALPWPPLPPTPAGARRGHCRLHQPHATALNRPLGTQLLFCIGSTVLIW